MVYSPVWLSSIELLQKYAGILDKASFFQKLRGSYPVPVGFPLVHPAGKENRTPLGYFAFGSMTINKDRISFDSENPTDRSVVFRHYRRDLSFDLMYTSVVSWEPFKYEGPTGKHAVPLWTRVRTHRDNFLGDFLIGVAGEGVGAKAKKANEDFFNIFSTAIRRIGPGLGQHKAPAMAASA